MPTSGSAIPVCVHCGGLAAQLTRKRRIRNFAQALPTFIGSFFTLDGFTTLIGLGLVVYLLKSIGLVLPAQAILIAYMFTVIQAAAQGAEKLPDPTDFTGVGSLVLPVLRFILAASYLWLPAVVYISMVVTWNAIYWDGPLQLIRDPFLLALIAGGILYFPIAIVVAAIADSTLAVLDLRLGLRIIARLPLQYAGAVLMCTFFLILGGLYNLWAGLIVALVPFIPLIPGILTQSIGATFTMVPGWILGRLIYQNYEHFGIMLKGADEEPEWPDAVPAAPSAPEGSQSHPVDPALVPGWDQQAPGLAMAADTMSHVPEQARRIDPPRREIAPIEVEGWSERDAVVEGAPLDVPQSNLPPQVGSVVGLPLVAGIADPPSSPPGGAPYAPSMPYPAASHAPQAAGGEPTRTSAPPAYAPYRQSGAVGESQDALTLDLDLSDDVTEGVPGRPPRSSGPSAPIPPPYASTTAPPSGAERSIDPSPSVAMGAAAYEFGSAGQPGAAYMPNTPSAIEGALGDPRPGFGQSPPTAAVGLGPAAQAYAPVSSAPGAPATNPGDPVAALERSLTNDPGLTALSAFVRCRDAGVQIGLSPPLELRLAGVLERAREYESAVAACRRAADQDLSGPHAARAVFMAAQIYEQRMGQIDRAAALYKYIVDTFAQDPLAARAFDGLQRLGQRRLP